ncbi:putative chromatin regulator PHD family [Rosa chinensis]|uniref:Putative chromatin regulator PHD family n=2 Tax=Rosa chinensis TaxID=74649 RepID=A0A2P6Q4A4_ROSCH|nr:putative chromatin regulator PHD family [Rosa chinensis]
MENSEDWCFICKDGGRLMLCDYEGCSKVYHPKCVGKSKSILKSQKSWTCRKHLCSECFNGSVAISFSCLCCTYVLCHPCYTSTTSAASEFSLIRGKDKEGLCKECLELVRLAESNSEYRPDGKRLDFEDRDTFECRFKECWEIIKENEGLTLDDVYSPNSNNDDGDDDDDHIEVHKSILGKRKAEAEEFIISDSDDDDHLQFQKSILLKKQKVEAKFIGWGSEPLIRFLQTVKKDTSKQLSHRDLGSAIYEYVIDRHFLEYPNKKTKVRCDYRLSKIFGKEEVDVVDVFSFLDQHLENVEETCYASIVTSNMKLVYLRRSLVEKLMLEQPESWERKVVGSFVRVENVEGNNSSDHKLIQVKGITKEDKNDEILLELLGREDPISISLLSDCDFTEEECEDLQRSPEICLLRRHTIAEIEQKARELHEDITKDWIERELVRLDDCITHEKKQNGWISGDLSEYWRKIEMLQQSSEHERRLKQVPQVIPERNKTCLFF